MIYLHVLKTVVISQGRSSTAFSGKLRTLLETQNFAGQGGSLNKIVIFLKMLVYSCLFSLFGYSPHRLDMQLMCFILSLQQVKTRSWMEKEISSQWAGGGFPRNDCLCLLYISVFLRRELSIRITLLWSYMFHSMGYFLHILLGGGNYQKIWKDEGRFQVRQKRRKWNRNWVRL